PHSATPLPYTTLFRSLTTRGIPAIVLDDDNTVSIGSRAICYAKRALEIWDRLGCGEVMLEKGVTWNVGKVYLGEDPDPIYTFNIDRKSTRLNSSHVKI